MTKHQIYFFVLSVSLLFGIGVGVSIGQLAHKKAEEQLSLLPQKADIVASVKRKRKIEPDRYSKIVLTTFHPAGKIKSLIFADSADWYSEKGYVDLVNPVIHEFNSEGKMTRRTRSKTGKAFLKSNNEIDHIRMRGNFKMESLKGNK